MIIPIYLPHKNPQLFWLCSDGVLRAILKGGPKQLYAIVGSWVVESVEDIYELTYEIEFLQDKYLKEK